MNLAGVNTIDEWPAELRSAGCQFVERLLNLVGRGASRESGGPAEFVLDGAADPGRERPVVGVGRSAGLLQQLRGEPHRHGRAEPRVVPSAGRPLRFLVFRLRGIFGH